MFPKTGTSVPTSRSRGDTTGKYARGIGAALRRELGDSRHATKTLMRWTNSSERSIKNWLAAKKGPRGDNLIELIRHSDEVLKEVLRLANRDATETLGSLITLQSLLKTVAEHTNSLLLQATVNTALIQSSESASKDSVGSPTTGPKKISEEDHQHGAILEFDVLQLNTLERMNRAFNARYPRDP